MLYAGLIHPRQIAVASSLVRWKVQPGGNCKEACCNPCPQKTVLIVVCPADQENRKDINPNDSQSLHISDIVPTKENDGLASHISTLRASPHSIS